MNASQARRVWAALADPSLLSEFGIRSASSAEEQYTNADYVTPYSNWRGADARRPSSSCLCIAHAQEPTGGATCRTGPIWINTNALIAYGLASLGMRTQALDVAGRIVSLLAADIRKHPAWAKEGKVWRECYSSADGSGLAAPGFLNWNTLAGSILQNLRTGENPFELNAAIHGIVLPP